MDDEIEYMGSSGIPSSPINALNRPSACWSPIPPPTGIVLHIEKEKSESQALTIRRPKGDVISLGRRTASDPEKEQDLEQGIVTFQCPVVSRKHAEIRFMDSGVVYIADQGSHHGTHLRRADDTVPLALVSRASYQLRDNDVITLGKTVHKDDAPVRPIVARVQLTYIEPQSPRLNNGEEAKQTKVLSFFKPVSKATGRYGVAAYTTSDDESLSSRSDDDSDSEIEELSSPPSPIPGRRIESLLSPASTSFIGSASGLLTRLVPTKSAPIAPLVLSPSPEPPSDIIGRSPRLSQGAESDNDRQSMQSPTPARIPEPVIIGAWPSQSSDSEASTPPPPPSIPQWRKDIEEFMRDAKVDVHRYGSQRLSEEDTESYQEQLDRLDVRVGELKGLHTSLADRLDGVSYMDILDMQAQIEALEDQRQADVEHRNEEVYDAVKKWRSLIEEMTAAKTEYKRSLEDTLMKAKEATAEIETAAKNAMAADVPSASSHKRKRVDENEEVEILTAKPSPKRARTIASVVFRTTATVTVGAVAAWSALAFS